MNIDNAFINSTQNQMSNEMQQITNDIQKGFKNKQEIRHRSRPMSHTFHNGNKSPYQMNNNFIHQNGMIFVKIYDY